MENVLFFMMMIAAGIFIILLIAYVWMRRADTPDWK